MISQAWDGLLNPGFRSANSFLFCLDMWCHCSWKILNATLVISHLEVNPVWKDSRCLWSLKLYISCSPVELELFLYWYIFFLLQLIWRNIWCGPLYQLPKRWSFHYQSASKRIFLEHKRVLWHRHPCYKNKNCTSSRVSKLVFGECQSYPAKVSERLNLQCLNLLCM